MSEAPIWTPLALIPICPWCGEELTDDTEDLAYIYDPQGAEKGMECGACGEPVMARCQPAAIRYQARKDEGDDD